MQFDVTLAMYFQLCKYIAIRVRFIPQVVLNGFHRSCIFYDEAKYGLIDMITLFHSVSARVGARD